MTRFSCRTRGASPALGLLVLAALLAGCTDKPTEPESFGSERPAPAQVQRIFNLNCTTSSCHGTSNPGEGLQLVTWDRMIKGSRNGEVVLPFHPEESHMIHSLLGEAAGGIDPRMPLSRNALPDADIDIIRQWIADGAPNDQGDLPYADTQRKIYVTNQGSDQISVLEADQLVVIKLIDVGVLPGVDSPHNVYVDPQNKYFYVSLINSGRVVQLDAETDRIVTTAVVGQSPANMVTSPDGKTLYVTNWNPNNATFHVLDAEAMTEKYFLTFPPPLGTLPHGLTVTADGSTIYTTHEGSGMVFRIQLGETAQEAILTPISLGDPALALRPLQVLLDQEEEHLFVTCNGSGEVRVIDLATDELVHVIPITGKPWLLDMTDDGEHIYVGNWGKDGVDVIDADDFSFETMTNATTGGQYFARPHGVAITDRYAFVSNENTNGEIPQHHPTDDDGPDGAVTVIDLQTQEVRKLLSVEVDPTGVAFVELP